MQKELGKSHKNSAPIVNSLFIGLEEILKFVPQNYLPVVDVILYVYS